MQKSLAQSQRRRSNRPGNSQATGLHRPDNLERGGNTAHRRGDRGPCTGGGKALRYRDRWGAAVIRLSPLFLLRYIMSRIAVLGAGITGVTTAYLLSRAGHEVTVVERKLYAAMETSFANGGQLSASNAEVWNQRATLAKGLRWMMQKDAPLLLNPRPSLHKYGWLAEFLWAIRKYRENTITTTQLAIEARQHLFAMAEQERSEEHTSELQSRENLVCRLLLEKK